MTSQFNIDLNYGKLGETSVVKKALELMSLTLSATAAIGMD